MLKVDTPKISPQQVEAFERDGVICVKNALDDIWIERMRKAVDKNISIPGPLEGKNTPKKKKLVRNMPVAYGLSMLISVLWLLNLHYQNLQLEF